VKHPIIVPATIIAGTAMGTMVPAITTILPSITDHFSHIDQIDFFGKFLATGSGLIAALFAPFVGNLICLYGKKKLFFVSILSMFVLGFAPFFLDFYPMLVSRFLMGFSVAGVVISTTTLIAENYQGQQRQKIMGLQASSLGVGSVVSILIIAFLADIDWRYSFFIYFLPLLVLPFIAIYITDKPTSETTAPVVKKNLLLKLYPNLKLIYTTSFLFTVLLFFLTIHLPFKLNELANIQPSDIGIVLSIWTALSAISSFNYHRVKVYLSYRQIFALALSLFGGGFIIIFMSTEYIQIIAGAVLVGLGTGLLPPNINSWTATLVPEYQRPIAYGWSTCFFYFGQFFLSLFINLFCIFLVLHPLLALLVVYLF
jgi:MFS family permease